MPTLRIGTEHENCLHFLTLTVIEWIDIFTKPEHFHVITDSLKFCCEQKGLAIYEYVIMTNHLHLIVRAREGHKLSQIMSDFKKHTTREIFKLLEKDNRGYILRLIKNSFSKKSGYEKQIWQRENFPELVLTNKFLQQKINYIHANPVRKGYVTEAKDWRYSSARNRISGGDGILTLDEYEG